MSPLQLAAQSPRLSAEKLQLPDPLGGQTEAIRLRAGETELICLPERALDLYSLCYGGVQINPIAPNAGLSARHFRENGASGFSKNFFIGMMTTCGLIQSGRPCEENGRKFGLHGCVSNTVAEDVCVEGTPEAVRVSGRILERHPEGECMELLRSITLHNHGEVCVEDAVTNRGAKPTPFMLMYHINFGAPFLSEQLRLCADWSYIENRDTGAMESPEAVSKMEGRGSRQKESVYYTRADLGRGVVLEQPELSLRCTLLGDGPDLHWMGIWKSFCENPYALGVEPCNAPGLGRVGAAARGLLQYLEPGAVRKYSIRLCLDKLDMQERG